MYTFENKIVEFIKRIDKDIQVEMEMDLQKYGLACEPTENRVYFGLRNTPEEENAFVDFVNELEPNFFQKYRINNLMLSILHEIGHIYTYDEDLEDDYNRDTDLLDKLQNEGLISKADQCKFYVRLELERLATQWAIDFVKSNQMFVAKSQSEIILQIA